MAPSAERPQVHSVAVELTTRCNQDCAYCYNAWPSERGGRPPAGEADRVVGRVRRLLGAWQLDHVTLTGGEPLLAPAVWPVLDLLRERRTSAQIISNGGLIDEALAARLAPYALRYVQVTLNGPAAPLHDEHAGGPGHFARAVAGIRALARAGVPVGGCTVLTRKNAASVGAILALFQSLGVRQVALSRFSPAGRAVRHAAALLPTLGDVAAAFVQALPFAREHGMQLSCTMPVPLCMIEAKDFAPIQFGSCAVGTSVQELALGPDGRIRNCTLHREALGDGRDILDPGVDLGALLADERVTGYRCTVPEFCRGCLHAQSCGGGCGAAAEWVFGAAGLRLPDPFLWQHVDDELAARLEQERAER
ncbi:MAG: radical SAM protein [Deltaproteobacteria bacterium]|nr:radical SAM protein [Deltaproteobacteria bacterium]